MKKAVVLLSGGLDSTTVLALAQAEGYEVHAISIRYGQRHESEIAAARQIARDRGIIDHVVIDIDLRVFGGSALTAEIDVPKGRGEAEIASEIPVTYVPARNTIFLSYALAFAEVLGSSDVFIGVNALDYSGYPDCRPEYIDAYERMANLATRAGVEGSQRLCIHAPLMHLTKEGIIRRGLELGVDYSVTRSCYDPDDGGRSCGLCDACQLRLRGFAAVGIPDPTPYQASAVTD